MAFVVFALSLVLLLAGLWSGYMSLDLLPTPLGVLYALAGAVAAAMAVLAFALGVAIRRIDALAALMRQAAAPLSGAHAAASEAMLAAPVPVPAGAAAAPASDVDVADVAGQAVGAHEDPAPPLEAEAAGPLDEASERPIDENRAGHPPTVREVDPEPEPEEASAGPPALLGRYSAAGANYMIFSDGSIEAETIEGAFTFPSMDDFKRFIAERREGRA